MRIGREYLGDGRVYIPVWFKYQSRYALSPEDRARECISSQAVSTLIILSSHIASLELTTIHQHPLSCLPRASSRPSLVVCHTLHVKVLTKMQSHTASNSSISTATETASRASAVDPWEEGSSRSSHDGDDDNEDPKSESASALSSEYRSSADTSKPARPTSASKPSFPGSRLGEIGSRKRSAPRSSSSASWNQSSNDDQSTKPPESAAPITNASSQRKSMMRDFYSANRRRQTEDPQYIQPQDFLRQPPNTLGSRKVCTLKQFWIWLLSTRKRTIRDRAVRRGKRCDRAGRMAVGKVLSSSICPFSNIFAQPFMYARHERLLECCLMTTDINLMSVSIRALYAHAL